MHIVCVGISHRTAPVEVREKVAMNEERTAAVIGELHALHPAA